MQIGVNEVEQRDTSFKKCIKNIFRMCYSLGRQVSAKDQKKANPFLTDGKKSFPPRFYHVAAKIPTTMTKTTL
jgi:hypothetical protein